MLRVLENSFRLIKEEKYDEALILRAKGRRRCTTSILIWMRECLIMFMRPNSLNLIAAEPDISCTYYD
jgi:hypothetical protein